MKRMTIVHISYAAVHGYRDPQAWLTRIDFFVHPLEAMARQASVVSIHCIGNEGVLKHNEVVFHFFDNGRISTWFPFSVHARVKSFNPDAVVVHGLVFPFQVMQLRFALGKKVKIFVQHHAEKPFRSVKKYLQAVVDRYIQAYFFTALGLAQPWIDARQISDAAKVYELMEVSSAFKPTMSDDPSRRQRYLWTGRLDDNKDPLTLIRGFGKFSEQVPGVELTIVWRGGNLLHEVNALIRTNRWNNIFLKEDVPHDELGEWYNCSGYIISTSHYEGSGTAVCEGMSCGCIPVLSDIPSFNMMTGKGKVGLLFNPGDPEGLTRALVKSMSLNLSQERQRVLDHFHNHLSSEAIASRMLNIISQQTV